jgi:Domain of unknown function (DUF4398)
MRRLSGLACALLLCAGCSEPPQKELDMAQGAIDAARAAGADQYAHEPFSAANSSLQSAREAVAQRDYRLALSRALTAREQAHEAAKRAADGKARTRSESETAIAATAAAIDALRQKLKAAEAAKAPTAALAPARATLRDSQAALQKARAAIVEGNYLEAGAAIANTRTAINKAMEGLNDLIDARSGRGGRRRR